MVWQGNIVEAGKLGVEYNKCDSDCVSKLASRQRREVEHRPQYFSRPDSGLAGEFGPILREAIKCIGGKGAQEFIGRLIITGPGVVLNTVDAACSRDGSSRRQLPVNASPAS